MAFEVVMGVIATVLKIILGGMGLLVFVGALGIIYICLRELGYYIRELIKQELKKQEEKKNDEDKSI